MGAAENGRRGGAAVPALQRGLEILEAVAARPQGATFSELKASLTIPSASLARLLQVLHAQRFLTRRSDATWQLGPSLVRLGSIAADRNDLFSVARPVLFELMRRVDETVELSIPVGEALLMVQKIESERSIRLFLQPGSHYHSLHALAPGKVYLAFGDAAARESFLARGRFKRNTPKTLVNATAIRAELRRVLVQGYAVDIEEGRPGVARVAAAVFDVDHKLTAVIAIAGPAARVNPRKRPELIEAVCAAARDLSHALGAKPTASAETAATAGLVLPQPGVGQRNRSARAARSARGARPTRPLAGAARR